MSGNIEIIIQNIRKLRLKYSLLQADITSKIGVFTRTIGA